MNPASESPPPPHSPATPPAAAARPRAGRAALLIGLALIASIWTGWELVRLAWATPTVGALVAGLRLRADNAPFREAINTNQHARLGEGAAVLSREVYAALYDDAALLQMRDALPRLQNAEFRQLPFVRLLSLSLELRMAQRRNLPARQTWERTQAAWRSFATVRPTTRQMDYQRAVAAAFRDRYGASAVTADLLATQVSGYPHGPVLQAFARHAGELITTWRGAELTEAANSAEAALANILTSLADGDETPALRILAADLLRHAIDAGTIRNPAESSADPRPALTAFVDGYRGALRALPPSLLSPSDSPELAPLEHDRALTWLMIAIGGAIVWLVLAFVAVLTCWAWFVTPRDRVPLGKIAATAVGCVMVALGLILIAARANLDDLYTLASGFRAGDPATIAAVPGLLALAVLIAALLAARFTRPRNATSPARFSTTARLAALAAIGWLTAAILVALLSNVARSACRTYDAASAAANTDVLQTLIPDQTARMEAVLDAFRSASDTASADREGP